MSKYLLGLMGLALLGGSTLLGQVPTAGQKGEPIPAPTKEIPVVGPSCPSGCCQTCCPKTKTVCCPEHYCKEKQKVIYTFGCEKKCLPYCHGLFHHHGCDDCDHGHCGHPITVRYLVKKVEVCQHDAIKCVPVEVPACNRGHCSHCANGSCSGAPVIQSEQPVVTAPVSAIVPTSSK